MCSRGADPLDLGRLKSGSVKSESEERMDEIQRLTAHDEIRRLIALYAQLVDSGRLEEWSHLFCEEASLRVYGQTFVGREPIREGIGAAA